MKFLFRNKTTQEQKLFDISQERIPEALFGFSPEKRKCRLKIDKWNRGEYKRMVLELEKQGWIR